MRREEYLLALLRRSALELSSIFQISQIVRKAGRMRVTLNEQAVGQEAPLSTAR